MIKRLFALALVFVVLAFASVPVFAAGVSDDVPNSRFYSYWNIQALFVTYTSGDYAVFDFPSNFLISDETIRQVVTLESRDLTKQLSFYVTFVDGQSSSYFNVDVAEVIFDLTGIDTLEFVFGDSIILTGSLLGADQSVTAPPTFATDISLIDRFSYQYYYTYPNTNDVDYSFTFSEGHFGSTNSYVPTPVPYSSLYYMGLTNDNLNYVKGLFTDQGYSSNYVVPYFQYAHVEFSFNHGSASNSLLVCLPLAETSLPLYAFYRATVSDWIDLYFEGYNELLPLDYTFAHFIGDVLGGFFTMELFFGITIGQLVLAIFAVFFVKAFLKYFAGG